MSIKEKLLGLAQRAKELVDKANPSIRSASLTLLEEEIVHEEKNLERLRNRSNAALLTREIAAKEAQLAKLRQEAADLRNAIAAEQPQ